MYWQHLYLQTSESDDDVCQESNFHWTSAGGHVEGCADGKAASDAVKEARPQARIFRRIKHFDYLLSSIEKINVLQKLQTTVIKQFWFLIYFS